MEDFVIPNLGASGLQFADWRPEHGHNRMIYGKRQEKPEMTTGELNKYRSVLEAKQAELVRLVRNRDGIAVEKSPDALDEVQHAAQRELAMRNLDRDSNLLRNVRGAQRRIEKGLLRRVPALRRGHQPQTPGDSAVDSVLHPLPGNR
jgi:hypothetical protein